MAVTGRRRLTHGLIFTAVYSRQWVRDQPESAEVGLTLHPRVTVGDPQRRRPRGEPAAFDREPVRRPIRQPDAAAGQLAVDVRQLQPVLLDPLADPGLLRHEQHPRRPMPARPHRADRGHNGTDQLIGQPTRLCGRVAQPLMNALGGKLKSLASGDVTAACSGWRSCRTVHGAQPRRSSRRKPRRSRRVRACLVGVRTTGSRTLSRVALRGMDSPPD